jgi:peptide/nickel transport system ATP-binding protein
MEYHTMDGVAKALNGVDLDVCKGEAVGLVGETGAGKTSLALAMLGLLPPRTAKVKSGEIIFEGINLRDKANEKRLQKMRGKNISMIFQNPLTSLNPVFTVGEQIAMVYRQHEGLSKKQAWEKSGEMLKTVGIPAYRLGEYPHQFSGGMRQRVGIAAALVCRPQLLIADEPTTALDVTIQAQVLELMKDLQKELDMSLLMITHNLGIVSYLCDKVAVMYAGRIIEFGTTENVLQHPLHPYTVGLIGALPNIKAKKDRLTPIAGFMSDPMKLPPGCKFHTRCLRKTERCETETPKMRRIEESHHTACFNIG